MAQKIVWTKQAIKDYELIQSYLLTHFGTTTFSSFLVHLNTKLELISSTPEIYPLTSKYKNVRKAVFNKRVLIFFRFRIRKKDIEILSLWDTRRNLNKDPYE